MRERYKARHYSCPIMCAATDHSIVNTFQKLCKINT